MIELLFEICVGDTKVSAANYPYHECVVHGEWLNPHVTMPMCQNGAQAALVQIFPFLPGQKLVGYRCDEAS